MEVYIIRHTTLSIEKGICYGQSDIDVSENFNDEVQTYDASLPNDFDAIYSSPLLRCIKLSTALNRGKVISDIRLQEINFGDWEMKSWNSIHQKEYDNWVTDIVNYHPNNGESLKQLNHRVDDFIKELRKKNHQKVLIITHSGVIRCFWKFILNIPLQDLMKLPINYGELFKINIDIREDYQWIIQKK